LRVNHPAVENSQAFKLPLPTLSSTSGVNGA
jgi:hypothetical protein